MEALDADKVAQYACHHCYGSSEFFFFAVLVAEASFDLKDPCRFEEPMC